MKLEALLTAAIGVSLALETPSLGATGPQASEKPQSAEQVDATTEQQLLAGTIRRYFESSGSIAADGLLTRSQIRGLQRYLRSVGRGEGVTHPEIVNRVLPDRARLVQLYYKKRGADVLRKTAEKLGGFEQLDMLSRDIPGMLAIQEAMAAGDHRQLVKYAQSRSEQPAETPKSTEHNAEEKPSKQEIPERFRRIYTVDEFIAAATSARK